jgi:hypothetical protein
VKEVEPKPDDHVVIKCRGGVTGDRSMQDIIAMLIKSYEEKKRITLRKWKEGSYCILSLGFPVGYIY